jgi:glycosyltransferase involved in cell wall biosynthesis
MDEVAAHLEVASLEPIGLTTLATEKPASQRSLSVLHVHSGNLFGGIERAILTCVENLHLAPSIRFEFALCFTSRFSEELSAAGQMIHKLPEVRVRNPVSIISARRNLRRLLEQKRYDVVLCHSPWSHAIFAPVIRLAGIPELFWAHARFTGKHWLERWARRSKPELVISNSDYSDQSVTQIFPGIPHQVLRCPVNTKSVLLSPAERSGVRTEFKTPDVAVVIMQVSRMEAGKGHEELLSAAATFPKDLRWYIWFVGGAQRDRERKYLEHLKAVAAKLGLIERVRFIGERNDVPRLLAAADLLCQPNTSADSFGLVFVEALSQSLPVVTFAMGGPAEIVDETCGVLLPPGRTDALAMQLERLIADGDLRRRLGESGPARAKALCDPVIILPQLESVLSMLSATKPR